MNDKIKCFVLVEKNDTAKSVTVKEEYFKIGSREAVEAENSFHALVEFAGLNGYGIICDGKLIYEPFKIISSVKELEEIRQKDLTELTEQEIILLAQSRAYGDEKTINGPLTIEGEEQFNVEYQKILEDIEQKKNGNKVFR